jgi:hypothetical protein
MGGGSILRPSPGRMHLTLGQLTITLLSCAAASMPAPHPADSSADGSCVESGGTVVSRLCHQSTDYFPNTCLIGGCGCAPASSHPVRVCDCGAERSFDGSRCGARSVAH